MFGDGWLSVCHSLAAGTEGAPKARVDTSLG